MAIILQNASWSFLKEPEDVQALTGHADLGVRARVRVEDLLSPAGQLSPADAVVQVDSADAFTEDEADAAASGGGLCNGDDEEVACPCCRGRVSDGPGTRTIEDWYRVDAHKPAGAGAPVCLPASHIY